MKTTKIYTLVLGMFLFGALILTMVACADSAIESDYGGGFGLGDVGSHDEVGQVSSEQSRDPNSLPVAEAFVQAMIDDNMYDGTTRWILDVIDDETMDTELVAELILEAAEQTDAVRQGLAESEYGRGSLAEEYHRRRHGAGPR